MPLIDQFNNSGFHADITAPGLRAQVVAPSDTVELLFPARGIYVGGTGNLRVITVAGDDVLFQAVPAGVVLPVTALKIMLTNTTATLIVALG